MWQAWINAILGLWFVLAAFLGFSSSANLWIDLIAGLAVVITSITTLKDTPWQAWMALVFAAWMIVSAFIPSLVGGEGYVYNDLISGLIIAIAGFATFGASHQQKLA